MHTFLCEPLANVFLLDQCDCCLIWSIGVDFVSFFFPKCYHKCSMAELALL